MTEDLGGEPSLDAPAAMGEECFAVIFRIIDSLPSGRIVEFGSGISSVRLGMRYPEFSIITFENNLDYFQRTEALRSRYCANAPLEVRHRPLRWQRKGLKFYKTYSGLGLEGEWDVVIVDGPPTAVNPRGREACLYLVYDRIKTGGFVILHDYGRLDEQSVVKNWMASYPGGFTLEVFSVGRQLAILKKIKEVKPVFSFSAQMDNLSVLIRMMLGSRWIMRARKFIK